MSAPCPSFPTHGLHHENNSSESGEDESVDVDHHALGRRGRRERVWAPRGDPRDGAVKMLSSTFVSGPFYPLHCPVLATAFP